MDVRKEKKRTNVRGSEPLVRVLWSRSSVQAIATLCFVCFSMEQRVQVFALFVSVP